MAWEVKRSLIGSYLVETGRDQGPIHFWNKENADLFAAAEDLLKLAQEGAGLHGDFCVDISACTYIERVRKPIAQIRGEQ